MKKLTLYTLMFATLFKMHATKYYLSLSGNDANAGTSSAAPWLTITKLNTVTYAAGDSVFFKCGDVFRGNVIVNQGGNTGARVVFTSYGSGSKPIISGAEAVSNWTLSGPATYGTIYQATFTQTPTQFFANDKEQELARFPNSHQYLTLNSSTTTNLYDASLVSVGTATINNSKICIHTRQWCWEKTGVSSVNSNTITFTGPVTLSGLPNYGYFLYDNLLHLDTIKEWKYDGGTQKINYIVPAGQTPTVLTCEASTYSNGIQIGSNASYITITGLAFEKQTNSGVLISASTNRYIKIDNCSFARQYNYGVNDHGRYNEISNSYFREVGGIAIFVNTGALKSTIHHNTFRSIGLVRNDGIGLQINSTAIMDAYADSCYIHHNDIDSAGYCGISVDGAYNTIERNVVKNAMMCNNDGAAYKSFGPASHHNSYLNNFAIGSNGVTEGTFMPDFLTPGIYFDFSVYSCQVKNNTIYNHNGRGIFQNAGNYGTTISGNVVYGSDVCIDLNGTIAQTVAITGMTIKRNSLFALNNTAYLIKQIDGVNNTFNMGYIDSNYLFNPYNAAKIAVRLTGSVSTSYSFAAWQGTGFDLQSKKSFVNWVSPTNNSTLVTNMTDNVNTYTLNGLYLDLDSNNVCNSVILQPYTSKVLINTLQTCVSGIHENSFDENILIYPNPASNQLFIEINSTDIQINSISISDVTGKVIKSEVVNSQKKSIFTGDLSNGLYLISLTDKTGNRSTKKIIINN